MGELLLKQANKIAVAEEVHADTAQAGADTSITLAAGASAVTDYYKNKIIEIVGGTGIGQKRVITAYNGSTKVATVGVAWDVNPDVDSLYEIPLFGVEPSTFNVIDIVDANPKPAREALARSVLRNTFDKAMTLLGAESVAYDLTYELHGAGAMHSGTAQAGAGGSITLAAEASDVNDYYNGKLIEITGGTGIGQKRTIYDYNGTSQVASVSGNFVTAPDDTSTYQILNDTPETDPLFKCLFGRKRAVVTPTWQIVSSSDLTTLTVGSAANYAVNDLVAVLAPDLSSTEVRRISSIDGTDITLSQALSASPQGKILKGGIQYQLKLGTDVGLRGLPSFFCRFLRGGTLLEKFAGNKISQGRIEWTSGQIVNVVLNVEGQRRTSIAVGALAGMPSDAAILPHIARYMHVFIGGTSYPLSNVFMQLANTLYRQTAVTTSGTQNLIRTAREVTGGFGLLYDEDYLTFEDAWDAQTLAELLLVSSKGDAALTPGNIFAVCMPQIKYIDVPKSDESGIYKIDAAFESVYVTGEDTCYAAIL